MYVLKTRLEQTWGIINYKIWNFRTSLKNIFEEFFFSVIKFLLQLFSQKLQLMKFLKFVSYVEVNDTNEIETKNLKLYLINNDNFPLLFGRD